jgi:hypothetical protein
VAGRPKRTDFVGNQEVTREAITLYLDTRLIAVLRETSQTRRRRGDPKLSVSSTAEGFIYWGAYCAYHHRSETEVPDWTYEDIKDLGLTQVSFRNKQIGTVNVKTGRYTPDRPEDYEPEDPPRRKSRRRA